ncbi:hypothetical protein BJV78DRAFT_1154544 [Lactifluus subvellereus]|nr:hypothetical protein BJV78DRAFT_1154544 [Lactifluus subvellereus]
MRGEGVPTSEGEERMSEHERKPERRGGSKPGCAKKRGCDREREGGSKGGSTQGASEPGNVRERGAGESLEHEQGRKREREGRGGAKELGREGGSERAAGRQRIRAASSESSLPVVVFVVVGRLGPNLQIPSGIGARVGLE